LTGMARPLLFTQVFAAALSPWRAMHLPGAPYLLATVLLVGSLLLAVAVTGEESYKWLVISLK